MEMFFFFLLQIHFYVDLFIYIKISKLKAL